MKRKFGCGPGLLGLGLLLAFVIGEHYLAIYIDERRFPWGYANSGTPPLVGTWVGPFTTRSGKRLAMLLDVELVPLGRNRRGTPIIRTKRHGWLEGRVLVCDGPGRVRHLEASGELTMIGRRAFISRRAPPTARRRRRGSHRATSMASGLAPTRSRSRRRST